MHRPRHVSHLFRLLPGAVPCMAGTALRTTDPTDSTGPADLPSPPTDRPERASRATSSSSTHLCGGSTTRKSPPGRACTTWVRPTVPSLISDYVGTPTPYGIGLRDRLRALDS
ncbi:hypothetical protein ACFYQ5_15840 [Streptomyces sp. NPDC005794]|uniref:hypothetical protein n=1 Tax=Streptomyces sp. NPDC005794 TaxID=3364733 RepID=UPI0036ACF98E